MPTRGTVARNGPARLLWAVAIGLVLGLSCRSKPGSASGGPAGSATVPVAAGRCRAIRTGSVLVVGNPAARADAGQDEEAIDLPFSTELGEARAGERGFAVPAIDHRTGASFAIVALIDRSASAGQIVELGRVYGGVEPPVVAALGSRWLIALPTRDAGGLSLGLYSLEFPYKPSDLKRGVEVGRVRADAPGFALSARGESVVVVWNTLENGSGRLAVAEVDPSGPSLRGTPLLLPVAAAADAEAPRLAPLPSGHLLAYLVRTPVSSGHPLGKEDGPDAGASEDLVEEGPNGIEVLPLDVHGAPTSSARLITPASSHVLTFDVAPLADGGALVTYREASRPGLDRPSVQAVRVRPDGSFEARTWDVGESPGLPAILLDSEVKASESPGWVVLSGDGATRLAQIGPDPLILEQFEEDSVLGASDPLALRGGRLLAALPRGTRQELSVFDCAGPPKKR